MIEPRIVQAGGKKLDQLRTQVTPIDTVLVTGASGGVGSGATQLAKARGSKIIAVTSRDKTADILRSKGCYGIADAIAGPFVELEVRTLYLKDLSFFGCTVLEPEAFPI